MLIDGRIFDAHEKTRFSRRKGICLTGASGFFVALKGLVRA